MVTSERPHMEDTLEGFIKAGYAEKLRVKERHEAYDPLKSHHSTEYTGSERSPYSKTFFSQIE